MASLFAEEEEDNFDIPDDIADEVDATAPPSLLELTPKSNPELLGHGDIEKALLNDFNVGRMPHALILAGPEGIGKATLAFRLARFLLSRKEEGAGLFGDPKNPETLYVAPEHTVFRRLVSGGHSDLRIIEREFDEKKGKMKKNIAVDAVREITPFLRKTAAEGGWRVVIVDGAEDFNTSSQNALLKILEEPPAKTALILTTTQPGSFLPTIRSRCRMVQMEPLAEETVIKLLDKLTVGISVEEKRTLARLGQGSIGRALRFYKEEGIALYKSLLKILATLPNLDIVSVHALADTIGKNGAEGSYETACEIMTGWCSRIVQSQARATTLTDIVSGDAEIFKKLASIYPLGHFMEAWEKMSCLFRMTEQANLDKRQAIISAFLILQKPGYPGLNI